MSAIELEAEALIIFKTQAELHARASRALDWRIKYQLVGEDARVEWANRVYERRIGQLSTTIEALGTIRAAYRQAGIRRTTRADILEIVQEISPNLKPPVISQNGQTETDAPTQMPKTPETTDQSDPLAAFKAELEGEPNWDIPSREKTAKLPNGRFAFGIRPSRVVLAAMAYDSQLGHNNPTLSAAIRESYRDIMLLPDGSWKPISGYSQTARRAIEDFFGNYYPKKGARLRRMPQEIQDTITRIKTDPLFRYLDTASMRRYANYEIDLATALLKAPVVVSPDVGVGKKVASEKKNQGEKMPELAAYQSKVVAEYIRLIGQNGWMGDNMARHVVLSLHKDEIPELGSGPESVREEIIKRRLANILREKARADKKLQVAIVLADSGVKISGSMTQLLEQARHLLKLKAVSLSDISNLIHNRISLEEIKGKKGLPEESSSSGETGNGLTANNFAEKQETREDISDSEIKAVYALLDVFDGIEEQDGNVGLRYQDIDDAFLASYREVIWALPPERIKDYIIAGQLKFRQDARSGFAKLERGRGQKRRGQNPGDFIVGVLNWIEGQKIADFNIYENRDIATLRKIAFREIPWQRFMPKDRIRPVNHSSKYSVTG